MIRLGAVDKSELVWIKFHARFIEGILLDANIPHIIDETLESNDEFVEAIIDGHSVAFTLGYNQSTSNPMYDRFGAICSMYGDFRLLDDNRVFPLCSSSFDNYYHTWDKYRYLRTRVNYSPKKTKDYVIAHMGYPGFQGTAPYRGNAMKALLKSTKQPFLGWKEFSDFILQINDCLVAIGAPGRGVEFLDRAPLQLMAFGCCVIHPDIQYPLPGGGLIPGVHYVKCEDDFSDVTDILDNPEYDLWRDIGDNVKRYFQRHLTPVPLWRHIEENVAKRFRKREQGFLSKERLALLDQQMRYQRQIDRYRRAREHAVGVVLDYGCGSGYGKTIMEVNSSLVAIISHEPCEEAREYAIRNHGIIAVDAGAIGHSVDTIVALEVLEHFTDKEMEDFRILVDDKKPERLILSFPCIDSLSMNGYHERNLTVEDLKELFPDYRILHSMEMDNSVFNVLVR